MARVGLRLGLGLGVRVRPNRLGSGSTLKGDFFHPYNQILEGFLPPHQFS